MSIAERPIHRQNTPLLENAKIKPNVLQKFIARRGLPDIESAETTLRSDLLQANPVKLKQKDIPDYMRHQKKGKVTYVADPHNPEIVYQVVTKGVAISIEEVLDFRSKTGKVRY